MLFTSGSTGRPKAVLVPHRAVVRLVRNTNYLPIAESDVWLQLAPLAFDASTLELWGPLLNGARLCIATPGPTSLEELGQQVKRHQVTTLWLTAGLFQQVVEAGLSAYGSLRHLLAGGDVLSARHVRTTLAELPGCVVHNGYGPTENTTFTCCHPMVRPGEVGDSVPIGRPIANTEVYLLDERLQPVPVGVPARLFTGGAGLARGYGSRADLRGSPARASMTPETSRATDPTERSSFLDGATPR